MDDGFEAAQRLDIAEDRFRQGSAIHAVHGCRPGKLPFDLGNQRPGRALQGVPDGLESG